MGGGWGGLLTQGTPGEHALLFAQVRAAWADPLLPSDHRAIGDSAHSPPAGVGKLSGSCVFSVDEQVLRVSAGPHALYSVAQPEPLLRLLL